MSLASNRPVTGGYSGNGDPMSGGIIGDDCGCPEIIDPCDPCGDIMTPIIEDPCGSIMTPVFEDPCGNPIMDPCDPCGDSILTPMVGEIYDGQFLENGQIPTQPASTSEVIEESDKVEGETSDEETETEVADTGDLEYREDLSHNTLRKPSFLERFKNWLS